MDIKVFRAPSEQEYRHHKVEMLKDQKGQKQKRDDQQQQKKKRDEKIDSIFSHLAENISHELESEF